VVVAVLAVLLWFKKVMEFLIFFYSCRDGGLEQSTVGRGVAVVKWQWYRWKEEIRARRMVPVRTWLWQYWQSCGGL
jgi:hypothetical protein